MGAEAGGSQAGAQTEQLSHLARPCLIIKSKNKNSKTKQNMHKIEGWAGSSGQRPQGLFLVLQKTKPDKTKQNIY